MCSIVTGKIFPIAAMQQTPKSNETAAIDRQSRKRSLNRGYGRSQGMNSYPESAKHSLEIHGARRMASIPKLEDIVSAITPMRLLRSILCVVPTVTFKRLFAFLIVGHD
jgi:hypothetical protein